MKWPRCLTVPRPPDFTVWQDQKIYLRRWWVIPRNKWFNTYLHNFCHSDDDRALHDHPWPNCSILLIGSYIEHTPHGIFVRHPWRPWAFWRLPMRRATSSHRVELIDGKHVWTLFLTGPVLREWGFHCPSGWVHWRKFVTVKEGGNTAGIGCGDDQIPHVVRSLRADGFDASEDGTGRGTRLVARSWADPPTENSLHDPDFMTDDRLRAGLGCGDDQ